MPGLVIFAWRRGTPPFLIGGAEVSQRLLAEQFVTAGWHVIYLGAHEPPWGAASELPEMITRLRHEGGGYELDRRGVLRYTWHGVSCIAAPQSQIEPLLESLLTAHRPGLVITSQEGSDAIAQAARGKAKVVGWLHSVSNTGMSVLRGQPDFALATSRFVLARAAHPGAVLFYPPFAPFAPNAHAVEGDLLMVNPVPAKGGALIRKLIALLPGRRFTLVEGWWNTAAEFTQPNITCVRRTDKMDDLYAAHRLLLVPSTVPDAFPRVIVEAALAALPAAGSDTGGISEAIGGNGLLLPPDDPPAWAQAITALTAERSEQIGRAARERAAWFTRPCLPELAAAGIIDE